MSKKERFAQIPLDVMQSEAFRWLPPFAVRVLLAIAADYTGFNNGGLECSTADAKTFGVAHEELIAGIGLCTKARLIKRTVDARRRSGKGAPARYALTWRAMGDFPAFDIVPTLAPTNDWKAFKEPFARPRTLTGAMRELGYRKRRPSRLHLLQPRSKRVVGTRTVKNTIMDGDAHSENGSFSGDAHSEENSS